VWHFPSTGSASTDTMSTSANDTDLASSIRATPSSRQQPGQPQQLGQQQQHNNVIDNDGSNSDPTRQSNPPAPPPPALYDRVSVALEEKPLFYIMYRSNRVYVFEWLMNRLRSRHQWLFFFTPVFIRSLAKSDQECVHEGSGKDDAGADEGTKGFKTEYNGADGTKITTSVDEEGVKHKISLMMEYDPCELRDVVLSAIKKYYGPTIGSHYGPGHVWPINVARVGWEVVEPLAVSCDTSNNGDGGIKYLKSTVPALASGTRFAFDAVLARGDLDDARKLASALSRSNIQISVQLKGQRFSQAEIDGSRSYLNDFKRIHLPNGPVVDQRGVFVTVHVKVSKIIRSATWRETFSPLPPPPPPFVTPAVASNSTTEDGQTPCDVYRQARKLEADGVAAPQRTCGNDDAGAVKSLPGRLLFFAQVPILARRLLNDVAKGSPLGLIENQNALDAFASNVEDFIIRHSKRIILWRVPFDDKDDDDDKDDSTKGPSANGRHADDDDNNRHHHTDHKDHKDHNTANKGSTSSQHQPCGIDYHNEAIPSPHDVETRLNALFQAKNVLKRSRSSAGVPAAACPSARRIGSKNAKTERVHRVYVYKGPRESYTTAGAQGENAHARHLASMDWITWKSVQQRRRIGSSDHFLLQGCGTEQDDEEVGRKTISMSVRQLREFLSTSCGIAATFSRKTGHIKPIAFEALQILPDVQILIQHHANPEIVQGSAGISEQKIRVAENILACIFDMRHPTSFPGSSARGRTLIGYKSIIRGMPDSLPSVSS